MLLVAALMLLATCISSGAVAAEKVALLIGNAAYQSGSTLRNPIRDARAMAAFLEKAGFETEIVLNADETAMGAALQRFARRTRGADTAFLYYSGHGMEIEGANYLIPTDANLRHPGDARYEAIELNHALASTQGAGRLSISVIDACRNNTFPSQTRSTAKGFRPIAVQRRGQVIAYATAPGTVAYDGKGDLSPYTQALLEALEDAPDLDVRLLFTSLGDRVSELAGADQEPFARFGRFPKDRSVSVSGVSEPLAGRRTSANEPEHAEICSDYREQTLFEAARDSESALRTFLETCPDSPLIVALPQRDSAPSAPQPIPRPIPQPRPPTGATEGAATPERARYVVLTTTPLRKKPDEEAFELQELRFGDMVQRVRELGDRTYGRGFDSYYKVDARRADGRLVRGYVLRRTLKLAPGATGAVSGDGDATIQQAQRALKSLGLYRGGLNGRASVELRQAITEFQERVGLEQNGRLTDETRAALDDAEKLGLATVIEHSGLGPSATRTARAQRALKSLGFYPDGSMDGRMSFAVKRAIRDFQERVGLKIDGQLSNATLAVLFEAEKLGLDAAIRRNGADERGSLYEVKARVILRRAPDEASEALLLLEPGIRMRRLSTRTQGSGVHVFYEVETLGPDGSRQRGFVLRGFVKRL